MKNFRECMKSPLGFFGQLIIGPPGSGKSTYCAAMQEFLVQIGRTVNVVNLDPANDCLPYTCSIDIKDLIQLDEVMQTLCLGPNGALTYCMEYLYTNRDWLSDALEKLKINSSKAYLIFDCPGQVELYCNSGAFRKLIMFLTHSPSYSGFPAPTLRLPALPTKSPEKDHPPSIPCLGLRLTAVHLVDSHYCTSPGNFISVLMTSLVAMMQLGLPHINVLSKVDLIEQYAPLRFNLDFFTDVLDLSYLVEQLDDVAFYAKYKKLNRALASIVQDNALINFLLLDVQEKTYLERVLRYADKGNGYVFGVSEERTLQSFLSCAAGAEFSNDLVCLTQEKYAQNASSHKSAIESDLEKQ